MNGSRDSTANYENKQNRSLNLFAIFTSEPSQPFRLPHTNLSRRYTQDALAVQLFEVDGAIGAHICAYLGNILKAIVNLNALQWLLI